LYVLDKAGQKLLTKSYDNITWPAIRSREVRNPEGCITGMEIMNPTKSDSEELLSLAFLPISINTGALLQGDYLHLARNADKKAGGNGGRRLWQNLGRKVAARKKSFGSQI
jgi:hypothetical protein